MNAQFLIVFFLPLIASDHILEEEPNCQAWRLPRHLLPKHYTLALKDFNGQDFTGSVSIDIECINKTAYITFHAMNIDINFDAVTLEVKAKPGNYIRIVNHTIDSDHGMCRLELDAYLTEGETYLLRIPEFKSFTHGLDLDALFRVVDIRNSDFGTIYATFLEPANARQVFPCFDEPNMKATFQIAITRDAEQTSFSNMPIKATVASQDNRFRDEFEETPLMSTYNLGLLISDFVTYPTNGSTRTRIVIPKEEFDQIDLDLTYRVADEALRELEAYTDIPYPLSKLDHVGVSDYAYNGMEHWGFIIYNRMTFYRMNSSYAVYKQEAYTTVIHEIAHQWFGNLVTLDWWPYFWLNEAIPTYLQNVIGSKIVPDWRHNDYRITSEYQKALRYDGGQELKGPVLPLTLPEICDINKYFRPLIGVSYEKGSSILRMFESILGGPEHFQTALRVYLKDRMYKNAKPTDLFKALGDVNNQFVKSHLPENTNFDGIGALWTEQTGVPLVTVLRDYASGTAFVKQERFYYLEEKHLEARWWIPLTWTTASAPEGSIKDGPQDWFYEDKTVQLDAKANEWILLNYNVTGYYRVNYDEENWSLLARALEAFPRNFSVANRAQIIDDAIQLCLAGRLEMKTALNITSFLQREKDPIVWISAGNNLRELYLSAEVQVKSADSDDIQKYIKALVTRAYNLANKKSGETHLDKLMRENIMEFACYLEVSSCEWWDM